MNYLGINLTKYVQDLYEENYKTLMKEIKEELNKLRDIPCLWIGSQYCQGVSFPQLDVYRFNSMPKYHKLLYRYQ